MFLYHLQTNKAFFVKHKINHEPYDQVVVIILMNFLLKQSKLFHISHKSKEILYSITTKHDVNVKVQLQFSKSSFSNLGSDEYFFVKNTETGRYFGNDI